MITELQKLGQKEAVDHRRGGGVNKCPCRDGKVLSYELSEKCEGKKTENNASDTQINFVDK